jgi:peptide/nickel transport system permease protein
MAARSRGFAGAENLGYLLRRLGQAVIVIAIVYVFTFLVLTVLPGDPISNALNNPENNYSEADKEQIIAYYGLDEPVLVQLFVSVGHFLSGDLGISYQTKLSVASTLSQALPSTLVLAASALMVAIVLAVLIALAVHFLPRRIGNVIRVFPTLFLSVPNFLIGLVVIQLFAFALHAFLIIEPETPAGTLFAAITLGIPVSAQIAQVLVTSLDETRGQNFVDVAKARGLTRGRIFVSHLVKPSALPALTVSALAVGELLGGSVITENVFGRRGVGTVVQQAIVSQDIPVLQATVVLSAAVVVLVNLVTDLAYPLLDPRIDRAGRPSRTTRSPRPQEVPA